MLKNESSKWMTLLTAVFFLALGVNFFIKPEVAFNRLGIAVGLVLAVIGLVQIAGFYLAYRKQKKGEDGEQPNLFHLLTGLVTLAFGILLTTRSGLIVASMQLIFALYAIVIGLAKLIVAVQYKMDEEPTWIMELIVGLGSIAFAILLFATTRFGVFVVAIITGLYLTLYGIYGLTDFFLQLTRKKRYEKKEQKARESVR